MVNRQELDISKLIHKYEIDKMTYGRKGSK